MQSKLANAVLALTMLAGTTPVVDAQQLVCGPNGCSYAATPVRTVARVATAPVRVVRNVVAAPVAQPAVVRSGLFGRRYVAQYQPVQAASYGSTGGVATYSAGSSGGTASYTVETTRYESLPVTGTSRGSSGGSSSYGDGPTTNRDTAAPDTDEPPAAAVPEQTSQAGECPCGPDCQCGPSCVCPAVACCVVPETVAACVVPELTGPVCVVPQTVGGLASL